VTTLLELRSVVRTQTQTDSGDLPDSTIDTYLQQGFERTINGETQWPFYAQTWDLVRDPAESTIVLPGDVNPPGIMTLGNTDTGMRLGMVPQEFAESRFLALTPTSGGPATYSVWGDTLYLWPAPAGNNGHLNYRLRGYRRPVTWLTPELSPDCDPRLHLPLTHYASALAYAQQEDEVLEATYMQRWQQDAELARRAIMEPVHPRPMVMGGSVRHYGPEFVPTGYIVTTPP